jgi:hypothetical protein
VQPSAKRVQVPRRSIVFSKSGHSTRGEPLPIGASRQVNPHHRVALIALCQVPAQRPQVIACFVAQSSPENCHLLPCSFLL